MKVIVLVRGIKKKVYIRRCQRIVNNNECGRFYATKFKYSQKICHKCMSLRARRRNNTIINKRNSIINNVA